MLTPERFRDAMSAWPSGVTVVAYRDEQRLVATTVSAFLSLSLDPPQVLVALGPNSTVRPFLTPGVDFGLSVLSGAQRRLAAIFADPFPVSADAFPAGATLVRDALLGLECTVSSVQPGGEHALVIADVRSAEQHDGPPLIRYRRRYHVFDALEPPD